MKKVKLLAIIAVIITYCNFAQAQNQDTTKYLLKSSKVYSYGLYVSPEFQYGQLKNTFTTFTGSSLMVLFNQKFAIGGTFQASTNETFSPTGISPLLLRSGFGGLKMEYITKPTSAVHVTFPLVLGVGAAEADSAKYVNGVWSFAENDKHGEGLGQASKGGGFNTYFVVQPGIQIEANLIRNVKIYAGANYRYAGDLNTGTTTTTNAVTIPATTLQGVSFNVGTKIGFFNFQPSKVKLPKWKFRRK